jgi:hypothetical protein
MALEEFPPEVLPHGGSKSETNTSSGHWHFLFKAPVPTTSITLTAKMLPNWALDARVEMQAGTWHDWAVFTLAHTYTFLLHPGLCTHLLLKEDISGSGITS